MRIASSQINFKYGQGIEAQIHFPYSIGCLLAYADTKVSGLDILPTCVFRDRLDAYIDTAMSADVLLCSAYVWNWEATTYLAREAKRRNPALRVIFGGPQVPDDTTGFFERYPFINIVVHGEGEEALVEALLGRQDREITPTRINDLSGLPSPYTSGMIDRLTTGQTAQWVASWETNRGCPYQCTFCDWGSATYTKLRQYPMERLNGEIDWLARRGIGYVDCCDANFGILPRDLGLAQALRRAAAEHGAPNTFRQSWAKNSSEKVIAIAQELKAAGMLTAVGLAVQSLDAPTLSIIKRKNLPFERFSDLTKQFTEAGLPTYTEVIRGLPGETLTTFKQGLSALAGDSRVTNIYIYNCGLLPNAPMANPGYVAQHGIETIRSPIYLAHSSIHDREIPEYEQIVVATKAMPRADMLEAFMFSWAIMLGESLRMFKQQRLEAGLDCLTFYEALLTDPALAEERQIVRDYAQRGYAGLGWAHHDPHLGDITWPIEEASWLRLNEARPTPGLARRPADVSLPDWARKMMWYGRRRGRFLEEPV